MAPIVGTVNKSHFNKCQAKIKKALECGCVFYEIKVEYVQDAGNQLRPEKFIISADNDHGFQLNVTIENKTNAPTVCGS